MSSVEDELPDEIYETIESLSDAGQKLFESGNSKAATAKWNEALALLPDPKNKWEAALWLYGALGDAYRSEGRLDDSLSYFQSAYNSADGHLNPYILCMLGVTLYDLNRKEEAVDFLLQAYMLEGEEIFEEEGQKYYDFLVQKKLIK